MITYINKRLKISLALIFCQLSFCVAQKYVTGVVTDAQSKQCLQGVSVVSGPDMRVFTDSVGTYRVPVGSLDVVLEFSCPGYTSRKVALQGEDYRDVCLFSRDFRSIKQGDDAFNLTNKMSVDEELATRFGSDLRVISRGPMPGVGVNMFIRGYNSLSLNSQPLVVIDGVIQNIENVESAFQGYYINPLSNIDVNNIERIEVLKNATSIYGSKGANGAIIITTKRGKSLSTKVDLDMNWGFDLKPRNIPMLESSQFRPYVSEMLKETDDGAYFANKFEGFLNDESDLTKNISYNTYHNNHDWSDDVYQTAFRQYYGLNVEGGDEVATYVLSASYMMGDGQIKETDYNRLSTHFNADVLLSKKLTLAAGLDFTYITRHLLDMGVNAHTSAPYLSLIKSPLLLPYQFTRDGLTYTSKLCDVDIFGVSNPISLIENSVNKYTQYRFGVNIMPCWEIAPWLKLSSRLSYNMNAVKEHYYSPIEGISPQIDAEGNIWQNTVKDQSINQGMLFSDTRLHLNKEFASTHFLDAVLGFRIQSNSYKSNYGEAHNTGSDKVVNLSTSLDGKITDGQKTSINNSALYAQAAYSYKQKYGVWGVLTAEACNTFGNEAEGGLNMLGGVWALFPSFGVNWALSSERFMSDLKGINLLNIRAEYGLTGNDALSAINRYAYLNAVNYFGTANGLQIANLDNQTQKWETTRKLNFGLDLGVWDERLTLSFDYFRHKTTDLLLYGTSDVTTGLENTLQNGGSMTNEGFEISIGVRPINLRKFKWNTELGMAHYKNKLTSLPAGTSEQEVAMGTIQLKEGLPIGSFYGYRTVSTNGATVFATEQQAQDANLWTWNKNKSQKLKFHAGDIHFADLDDNHLIDENDRTVIGDANPDLTGSWANRFAYDRFTLDLLFTFSVGADIYNYQRHTLESMSSLINQSEAVASRWKYDGQVTNIPRAIYGDPMQNSRFSDRFIEDGSYLKLKEVRLSYQLDLPWELLSGTTIWGSVSNLHVWTKYLGSDPEVSYGTGSITQGIDYGVSPFSRSVQFGIKLNF